MDLTTITVDDFKSQFPRDFPYLPIWLNTTTYNTGDRVYYNVNGLFYDCLNDGVTTVPTTVADWVVASDDITNYVLDSDVDKAFIEARISFNQGLGFADDATIQFVYLYATAHYLVHDLRATSQGVNGNGSFPINSKSTGSVNVSYTIPEAYTKSPHLTFYTSSTYGLKYLNLVYPMLRGNVGSVCGGTQS